jgi:ERF superfamily
MSVYTKLNEARLVIHGMSLKKSGHNKFSGYYYFELGDFLVPAIQVFNEVGLCAVVSFTAEVASMTIIDTEDNSQIVITSPMGSAALKGCHEVQNVGAVETYQRRYLWVSALEIVEHDAIDAGAGKDDEKPVARSGREYAGHLSAIEKAADMVALQGAWKAAAHWGKDNPDYLPKLTEAKDKQKTKLEQAA